MKGVSSLWVMVSRHQYESFALVSQTAKKPVGTSQNVVSFLSLILSWYLDINFYITYFDQIN